MKVHRLDPTSLKSGQLVLTGGPHWGDDVPSLRLVSRIENQCLFLIQVSMFMDEDAMSEIVSFAEAPKKLCRPEFEVGDLVFFRSKPSKIVRTLPGDMHVYVETAGLAEPVYTNLIHLDFTPTLVTLNLGAL